MIRIPIALKDRMYWICERIRRLEVMNWKNTNEYKDAVSELNMILDQLGLERYKPSEES